MYVLSPLCPIVSYLLPLDYSLSAITILGPEDVRRGSLGGARALRRGSLGAALSEGLAGAALSEGLGLSRRGSRALAGVSVCGAGARWALDATGRPTLGSSS